MTTAQDTNRRTPLSRRQALRRHAVAAAAVLALAGAAHAQISTSTLRGQVSAGSTAVAAGTVVTAVNQANGNTWRTTTLDDGSYVLAGLAPGAYEIRVAGPGGTTTRTEVITLLVGQTASLDLALGGSAAATGNAQQTITIVGSAQRADVKTSEVGTNVSRRLIDKLPQQTHNFLSSADLAPGVAFSSDGGGNTRIQSGAQNFDHVNVFIDGVGQKNNILRGGVTGQDTSRGNPFPQSAIAEYKVLTQNYKAEFDQVSSAAITAITRSGSNEFHGDAYVDRTSTNWRSKSIFEQEKEAQGVPLPPSTKNEFGFSFGGPIVRDQLHFFMAYDGKKIDDSRQVVAQHLDLLPAGKGIVPQLAAVQGSQVDHFKEHLLFGKIDAQLNDEQRLTVSARVRRESDHLPEDRLLSVPGNDKDRRNNETRFDLTHEWSRGAWLNELRLGYEDAVWNPRSSATTPLVKYLVSTATPQAWDKSQEVLYAGGSPDAQRRQQTGTTLGDDLTYTGLKGHVLKGGAKVKAMKYDLSGTARSVDIVQAVIDTTTGNPYYDGTNCLGTNLTNSGAEQTTTQCRIQRAIAPAAAVFSNQQYGIYVQDDWALTKQWEVNAGVRWDYETNMLNNSYVTPADRVAAVHALDSTRYNITPPAGQTYAQSLAKGGINIDDYIADGHSRNAFKGALAPRVGASYDVFADRATVVFGGYGRSYDRTMANHALDELQKNQQAGGEIWLIRNKFKMPFADQFSIGLRQALGAWNAEVALARVEARNQFEWFLGNRDANGGYATQSPIDPLWGGPNGYGSLILGDFVGRNRTNSLLAKLEKPYSVASGWSVNVAYTYSDAKTTARGWDNDIFDFTYGKPGQGGWKTSKLVDKHRVVVAGLADNVLPWGLSLSGKATFASGMPRQLTNCSTGFSNCVYTEGSAPFFRQVDASLSKDTTLFGQTFSVRADVLNLFNSNNFGGFDDWVGGPGNPQNYLGGDNATLGKPNSIRGDVRTFRLALAYRF